MADQLVSADPNWAAAQAAPNVPHMSAAPEDRPVTLGDLREDPGKAIARIGTILKKDASDPRLWLGLAASYFAPKIFNVAAPVVARAANAVGRVQVNPSVAMREFSLTKPQNVLKAVSLAEQPVADRVPGFDRYMPNSGAPPSGVDRTGAPLDLRGAASTLFRGDPASVATPPESVSGEMPPPAGPPAPAAPVESPAAPASPPKFPLQKALNELAIQARRQTATLTPEDYDVATGMMRDHGVSAADAVSTLVKAKATPAKLKMSADESTQYLALRSAGKSGAQAEAAILKMRTLATKLKTPSGEQVTDAVTRRNQTGRWDE